MFSAATFPSPAILFRGGLIPSSSIINLVASDSYKSIGKNFIPLSYISSTISSVEYISLSFAVAAFPSASISRILLITFSLPCIMYSLSKASALIEKYAV